MIRGTGVTEIYFSWGVTDIFQWDRFQFGPWGMMDHEPGQALKNDVNSKSKSRAHSENATKLRTTGENDMRRSMEGKMGEARAVGRSQVLTILLCYFMVPSTLTHLPSHPWQQWISHLSCFPSGSDVKNLPTMRETRVWSLGWKDPMEKGMANQSSVLAWRIPQRGAWWATVRGVTKSQILLGD